MDLAGKDYLTEREAAHYCGVSYSQFRAKAVEYGLVPGWFMGKKLYRRADLQRVIEQSWQQYALGALPGSSRGPTQRANTAR